MNTPAIPGYDAWKLEEPPYSMTEEDEAREERYIEDQLDEQRERDVPLAALDQYADDAIDSDELAEIMEAPLAPAESPTPWRIAHVDATGCVCIYDAGNGFIGTVTSRALGERIVNAVNQIME